jgi:superfamily II DNA or RNA helicase
MSFSKPWRPYQLEANEKICFETKNRILVKMFCGTGKSLIMRYGKAFQNHSLIVYVFPSLSLINQFEHDYLQHIVNPLLIVSSDDEGTTNEEEIQTFLQKPENKILCITYQSFHLIKDIEIPMCVLDEAHHVTSETYQPLFLENSNIQKMCLFTATPKEIKGVDYGEMVYEYSYLRGVAEGYLNPFEIRVDLVGEDTHKTIYNSIARAYYTTGNNRILTFHADVNTDSPTSVRNFVNPFEIQKAFEDIQKEFPTKHIPKIHTVGFYSELKLKERRTLLESFDACQDVFILSSCETMGEGVDTKNANMCVFVDPKSSFVKIIQNIGRIVRKQFGVDKPHSTILLPIFIDKTKYETCTTTEECDMAIRQDMAKGGDFTPILNVLSALKQEDEDLYEICLHYPTEYSPQEIEENLRIQGHTICEQVDLDEVLERVEEEDVQVDVHTNSLEEPIITYGESDHVINVLQEGDEYYQIEGEETKINHPNQRVKMIVHTNPDVKVFWKLEGEMNLGSCLIDCELVDNWNERLEELGTFFEKEKRIPNVRNDDKEKTIAYWLIHKRHIYKEKKCMFKNNIERCKQWEDFIEKYKEYFKSDDEKWNKQFEELKQFININKRRPNKRSETIGLWLQTQICNYKNAFNNNDERCIKWEKFMEEYNKYFTSLDELWDDKLYELKEFMNKEKRRPSQQTKLERPLGLWLTRQISNYKTKTDRFLNNLKRCEQWTNFMEEYKEYLLTSDELWIMNLHKLKQFMNKEKRKPHHIKESILEKWLTQNQMWYKFKTYGFKSNPERCKLWEEFLEEYKEYVKSIDDTWNEHFENLKQFLDKEHRRPIQKQKLEKSLAYWLCDQLSAYNLKSGGFKENPDRCKQWEDFIEKYKEYFKSDDEKWNKQFEELKQFIYKEKRKPSRTKESEKYLGQWLSNQSNNRFKDNPERCKLWQEFLEEYKEYLTTTQKKSMKLRIIPFEEPECTEQRRIRVKSELSVLHQQYKTMRSDTLAQYWVDNPTAWQDYHRISETNEETFPSESIPRNQIIRELEGIKMKKDRTKDVLDLGCGKGLISKYFQDKGDTRFKFTNIDHVAINESVQVGDISKLPFEDESVEICILSLAMWGSNCKEYIQEVHRVLESGGRLYIIEPTKRWTDLETEPGGRLREWLKDFKILQESIEKFTFFVAMK